MPQAGEPDEWTPYWAERERRREKRLEEVEANPYILQVDQKRCECELCAPLAGVSGGHMLVSSYKGHLNCTSHRASRKVFLERGMGWGHLYRYAGSSSATLALTDSLATLHSEWWRRRWSPTVPFDFRSVPTSVKGDWAHKGEVLNTHALRIRNPTVDSRRILEYIVQQGMLTPLKSGGPRKRPPEKDVFLGIAREILSMPPEELVALSTMLVVAKVAGKQEEELEWV